MRRKESEGHRTAERQRKRGTKGRIEARQMQHRWDSNFVTTDEMRWDRRRGRSTRGGASVVISSRQQVLFPFSSSLPPINYIHYSIFLFLQQNVDDATEKLRAKEIEVLALICHVSNDQQRKDLIQKIAQDAAPHLHKGSSVVIISSVAGFNPPASMSMYEVTKTALFGLTK
ncbi:hypothetical protein S245_050869, partial [Arachis hypogaea]